MKPTFGAISAEGQKAFAPTFDTFGFFARSLDDLQLLADVFGLQDDDQPKETVPQEISIAVMTTPMWPSAGPGTRSAIKKAVEVLHDNQVKNEEVPFPPEVANAEMLKRVQKVITLSEARICFLKEYRMDKTNLATEICDIVENTNNFTHEEATKAAEDYAHMRHLMNKLARNYSAILTPSAVDEAPLGLGDMGSATFNTMWTVSVLKRAIKITAFC